MTQPRGAVATPVPPLIALPCLMLGFGPVPQRSLLNLAGGESVSTGVLGPKPAPERSQHSSSSQSSPPPSRSLPGYSNNRYSLPLGSLDSSKPSGWISRPSPSGSPVSLRRRLGVTSQSGSSGSSGVELGWGWALDEGGGWCAC